MELVVGLSVLSVSFLESSGKKKKGQTSEFLEEKSIKSHEAHAAPPPKVGAVGSKVGGEFFIFFQGTSTLNTLILPLHKTSAPHLDIRGCLSGKAKHLLTIKTDHYSSLIPDNL